MEPEAAEVDEMVAGVEWRHSATVVVIAVVLAVIAVLSTGIAVPAG